jgi:hypothetical protein
MEIVDRIKDRLSGATAARAQMFADAQTASERMGSFYAARMIGKGATITMYQKEQQDQLLGLFREKIQEVWISDCGVPLTEIQLESLEESFGRSFYTALGSRSSRETHMRSGV